MSIEKKKMKRKEFDKELRKLQVELVKLQEWVKASGAKICVVFEGRDTAGKGGVIKRIVERVSPRVFRVVALPAPTAREKSQMYFQRYMPHLPAAGEVVIFDRETDTVFINAGFGAKTQWYQNLLAQPEASIQLGWKKMDVQARQLSPEEGGELFLKFVKTVPFGERYPKALGYEVDGTDDDYRAMGEMMIFLALEPR